MESQKHKDLVIELGDKFTEWGYLLKRVDGVSDGKPEVVENSSGVGDGEDKRPDIDAYDEKNKRVIRGEAKVGDGDIETEHSVTQYQLFSNKSKNGVPSWLYIIVPKSKHQFLNNVIVGNVPESQWNNIQLVSSDEYSS